MSIKSCAALGFLGFFCLLSADVLNLVSKRAVVDSHFKFGFMPVAEKDEVEFVGIATSNPGKTRAFFDDFADLPFDFNKKQIEGKWLELFPVIRRMIEQYETGKIVLSKRGVTSAEHTIINFDTKIKNVEGDMWKGQIQAHDHDNQPKHYGGDYFKVLLYRGEGITKGGVSCKVRDNEDGTYAVECPLPWHGQAYLRVFLEAPIETIFLLMLATSKQSERYIAKNNSFINSFGKREYGICDVNLQDRYNDSDLCDYSNRANGESWFCVKPPSRECNPIENQLEKVIDYEGGKAVHRHKYNFRPKVIGSSDPSVFSIEKRPIKANDDLVQCSERNYPGVNLDPNEATGWSQYYAWKSYKCVNQKMSVKKLLECMKNKVIYVVGDSVAYQWFNFLNSKTLCRGVVKSRLGWSSPKRAFCKARNITLHYMGHGPPLHAPGPPSFRPYLTNTIDGIKRVGRETHFLFAIGPHFGAYHPDVFINRLIKIKKSISKLLKRSPEVSFYVIGMTPHKPWEMQPNVWLMYRHEIILRKVFGNMKRVIYMPFWDLASIKDNKKVHVLNDLLLLEMGIFQSYLCTA